MKKQPFILKEKLVLKKMYTLSGQLVKMELSELNQQEKAVYDALKEVIDPELGVSLIDLGLIYEIEVNEEGDCHINWALTTMGCPIIADLTNLISQTAMSVDGIKNYETKLVY